jgi:Putative phage serine protease XkdF
MDKNLPIYDLLIDESKDSTFEVNYVAFVDKPAIQRGFLAFNEPLPLKFGSDDERIVVGPAMVPDMLIYRNDPQMGEFYVKFSKQTIADIALKFFEKGYHQNVNLMHNQDFTFDGVTFFQSFIKDTAKGISGMDGEYPEGTWFLAAKVNNDEAWSLIKAGKVKGFSVEGMFKYKPKKLTAAEIFEQVEKLLGQITQ